MISQRDITAFFTVIDVLADPSKMKQELDVLQNMRASIDADMQRMGEEKQKAAGVKAEADAIIKGNAKVKAEQESVFAAQEVKAKELQRFEDKLRNAAAQQQEISRLLDAREKKVKEFEEDNNSREQRLEGKAAALDVREEALRKKEADYTARMSKLRQIAE